MKRIISVILFLLLSLPATAYADFPRSSLNPDTIPPYTPDSDYYIELNDNVPDFEVWQRTAFPFVIFSPLDSLGRVGTAYACLGPETLPTDVRGQMGNIHPSGWQSTQYEGIDGGYLFNRSHLIAYQLCGDSGTMENLFTGTRNLNAGVMLLVESAVEMYIEETGGHVLYRVTPFYHGDDLVPFGIQIEAESMESYVDGFSCNLFLYNIQPGIEIDYSTGESWRSGAIFTLEDPGNAGDAVKSIPAEVVELGPEPEEIEVTYVLNKNSHKFHYPSCDSVSDIKAKNRMDVDWSREEVIEAGYTPCGRCTP